MEAGSIVSSRSRSSSQPILMNRSQSLISLSEPWTKSSTLRGFGKTYSSKGKKMHGLGSSDKKTIKIQRAMGSSEFVSRKEMHGFGWNVSYTTPPREARMNQFMDDHLVKIRLKHSQLLNRPKLAEDPFPDIEEISPFGSQEDLTAAKAYPPRRSFSADSGRKDSLEEIPNFALTPYWSGFVRGVYPNSLAVDDLTTDNYNTVQQELSSKTVSPNPTKAEELSDFPKHIPETDVSDIDVEIAKSSQIDNPVIEVKAHSEDIKSIKMTESDLTTVCDNGNVVIPDRHDSPGQPKHVIDDRGYTSIGDPRYENENYEIAELDNESNYAHVDSVSSNTVLTNKLSRVMVSDKQYENASDGSEDTITTEYPLLLNANELDLKRITHQEYHGPQTIALAQMGSKTSDILEGTSDCDSSEIFYDSSVETKEHNLYSNSIKEYSQELDQDIHSVHKRELAPRIMETSDILEGMSDSDMSELLYGRPNSIQTSTTTHYIGNHSSNPELEDMRKSGSVHEEVELVKDLHNIMQYENIMIPNYGEDSEVSETSTVDNVGEDVDLFESLSNCENIEEDISLESTNVNTHGMAEGESQWKRSNPLTTTDVRSDDGFVDSSSIYSSRGSESGAQTGLELSVFHDNKPLNNNSVDDLTHL